MKKIISVILTLAMLVSVFALFPSAVLAAGDELTIAGTVAVRDGSVVVSSGTNWTYASATDTLTLSSGFSGAIAISGLGILRISTVGSVSGVSSITAPTAGSDNVILNGSLVVAGAVSAANITVNNATVDANSIEGGNIYINGGTIDAGDITGNVNIVGGNVRAAVVGKTPTIITLDGANDSDAVSAITGITGYGTAGMKTIGDEIYIYPSSGTVTSVTAGGVTYYGSAAAGTAATFTRRASGTMNISGTVSVGSLLTASVTGKSPSDAAFDYKWYRDNRQTTEVASGTTYTPVVADIGKKLIAVASCTNYAGELITAETAAVPKLQEAGHPETPTTLPGGVGDTYITAGSTGVSGKIIELQARYTGGTTGWVTQTGSSVTFSGLTANTAYKIYARYKETATVTNGPDSGALSVTTTKRVTPVDPVTSNMIYGIYDGNVLERGKAISFIAIGGGMDNTAPITGDTRYVPINWFVNPSGVWVAAPYYATIPANSLSAGWHTLTVTYRRQVYSGTAWVSQTTAPQTVTTSVRFYITGSNNPKMGEPGDIWLYVGIIAGVAMIAGSAIAISVRRRKNTQ